MVVFRGWGLLVVFVPALLAAAAVLIFPPGETRRVAVALAVGASALPIWGLGRYKNRRAVATARETGWARAFESGFVRAAAELDFKAMWAPNGEHSLLFVRMEYWAVPLVLIGAVFYAVDPFARLPTPW